MAPKAVQKSLPEGVPEPLGDVPGGVHIDVAHNQHGLAPGCLASHGALNVVCDPRLGAPVVGHIWGPMLLWDDTARPFEKNFWSTAREMF